MRNVSHDCGGKTATLLAKRKDRKEEEEERKANKTRQVKKRARVLSYSSPEVISMGDHGGKRADSSLLMNSCDTTGLFP